MIELIDLSCGSSTHVPVGTLSRHSGGWVSVTTKSSTSRIADEELTDSDRLVVAVHPDGLLALGEESHSLLSWDATTSSLRVLGSVARLDLSGYDPGGLSRVLMHPADEGRVLLETEVGFSLVDLSQGVVWAHVHDDLTTGVDAVSAGVVHVSSERAAAQFSLTDGSYLGGEPHA